MAKDQRTITGTVRMADGKTFNAESDMDEFAAAASPEQIARLTGKGVIAGFDAKADKAAAEAEKPATSDQDAKGKAKEK